MATTRESGKSKIVSFSYNKGLCFVKLADGHSGCIGESKEYPLAVMLHMKTVPIIWEKGKKVGDKQYYNLSIACID